MLGKANNFFAMSYRTSFAGDAPFEGLDLGTDSGSDSGSDSDFGNTTNNEERSVALAGDAYKSDDDLPFARAGDGDEDEDEDEVYKELCDCFPNCGIKPPDYIKLMNAGGIKAVIAVVEAQFAQVAQDALMAQALARDAG